MSFLDKLFKKKKKDNPFLTPQPQRPKAVDLRSDRERQTELNSVRTLAEDREALAQEMVLFLKTHDTGNNAAHYNEFRERFRDRAQKIAENGGYHQALQEIYYRVRELCREEGTYFHSGALDHAFEGEYWQR